MTAPDPIRCSDFMPRSIHRHATFGGSFDEKEHHKDEY